MSLPVFSLNQQLQFLQDTRNKPNIQAFYTPSEIAVLDLRIAQLLAVIAGDAILEDPTINGTMTVNGDANISGNSTIGGCLTTDQLMLNSFKNNGFANEYHVGATDMPNGRTFTTIQAAIDQAFTDGSGISDHVSIIVHPGFYIENLTININATIRGFSTQRVTNVNFIGSVTVVPSAVATQHSITMQNFTFFDTLFDMQSLGGVDQDILFYITDCLLINLSVPSVINVTQNVVLSMNGSYFVDFSGVGVCVRLVNGAFFDAVSVAMVGFATAIETTGPNLQTYGGGAFTFSTITLLNNYIESDSVYASLPDYPKKFIQCDTDKYRIWAQNNYVRFINTAVYVDGIIVNPVVTDCLIEFTGGLNVLQPAVGGHYLVSVPNVPGVEVVMGDNTDSTGLNTITSGNFRLSEGPSPVIQKSNASFQSLTVGEIVTELLAAAPGSPIIGAYYTADGTTWDPAGKVGVVPYPVFYDGVAFIALY